MSLEKLLNLPNLLDEEILRQYSKIAKQWEDKNNNIMSLAAPIGLLSIPSYIKGTVHVSHIAGYSLYMTVFFLI